MPINTDYTTMDVLALDIRDLVFEPLASGENDGYKFTNAMILRAFNRAIKHAISVRKGIKAWLPVATVAGVNASVLPAGTLAVYQANYKGQPLNPVTSWEKDVALANSINSGGVNAYSIDGDPPSQITLIDAPGTGTTDLQVYALYFPQSVADLTAGSSSPLPPYYDDFLVYTTAGLLLTPDEGTSQDLKYAKYADVELKAILAIEEPRVKDPQGDRFRSVSEYYPGESD